MINLKVEIISREETKPFILNMHYAGRMPSISYSFGLFDEADKLVGVVTYGKPASNSLCIGVCGSDLASKVFELNRLVLNPNLPKNSASKLVGGSLKLLKQHNLIIVSYADTAMSHIGYVYQATNWLYTGSTPSRTDKFVPKGKHSRHYKSEDKPKYRVFRSSKHRYVYFAGDKGFCKATKALLNYKVQSYPKGDSVNYELGTKIGRKLLEVETGKVINEA